MPHKVAIAFLHGIGSTEPGYSASMQQALSRRFSRRLTGQSPDPARELVFEEVNWSPILELQEDQLWEKVRSGDLRYDRLRRFMIFFAADAIAYQPAPSDRSAYDAIHQVVASSLSKLADRAGPRAPLCIVAHSLGTIIASNYIYDLAKRRASFMAPEVRAAVRATPLERGETLSLLCTMGSPIALWSLRYPHFGEPIRIPPRRLRAHHPGVTGRWINFYDSDDVIGYPLRTLNAKYQKVVSEDRAVDVGSILTRWNPMSHTAYWGSASVADAIAEELARVWIASSAVALVPERRRRTPRTRRLPARGALD